MEEHGGRIPALAGDTQLVRFLFPKPAERRTGPIIRWWESRRLKYNLIVGGAGLTTMGLMGLMSLIPLSPPLQPIPLFAIIPVGILANICYSLGPAIEVAANKMFGDRLLPLGPTLFRNGLVFSVGLVTVLPLVVMTLTMIVRFLVGVF